MKIIQKIKSLIKKENDRIFFSKLINPEDLCFDIGANIGDKTELFLSLGAKVIAVEPQPLCIETLRNRFNNNGNLIIVDKGIASEQGKSELNICKEYDLISTFSKKWMEKSRFKDYKWDKSKLVELTTLDNLVLKYGVPDFCKIDVEGFEIEVFKGLTQRLKMVSFEFVEEFADEMFICIDYLSSIGDIKINCCLGESKRFIFSDWTNKNALASMLKSKMGQFLWGDIYVKFKNE